MKKAFHIAELIARKQGGSLSAEEERELEQWLEEDPSNREVFERTGDSKLQLEKLSEYSLFDADRVRDRLEDDLFGGKLVQFQSRRVLRYAATILLPLLMLGGAAWWFLGRPGPDLLAEIDTHISPGEEQAILVLSDGSSIVLDATAELDMMNEGGATIQMAERGIRYQLTEGGSTQNQMVYNTLMTPRGGSYRLSLADGTRVWLNAGSSLHFPVSFQDSIRQLSLEGEAYFEVMPGSRPFIVSSGGMDTRVLGTSFNVSAYGEDAFKRTTLLEGSVEVSWTTSAGDIAIPVILEPDQQVSAIQGSSELLVSDVDAAGYMSWVEGKMEFHRETLSQVMKRLARWYDFEYEFENEEAKDLTFSARLDRSSQISEILDMLALTTEVGFTYDGERVVVH